MKLSWLALALALLGTLAGVQADPNAVVSPAFFGKPLHRSTGAR